jgi:hypothetical protein
MNPWKLTPAEVRTMEDLIEQGSPSQAAAFRGLSLETINEHQANIRYKMRPRGGPTPTALQRAVMFDRWARGRG